MKKIALILIMLFSLNLPSQVHAALIGYWNFNEGVGGTAYDSSPNSYDGTILGATWTPTASGNALQFDGIDDEVAIYGTENVDISTAVTVEAWVNFDTLAHDRLQTIFYKVESRR